MHRLSVSSLRDFHRCGAYFDYKRVKKLQPDEGVPAPLAAGNLLHSCYYYAMATPEASKDGGGRVTWELNGNFFKERAMDMFRALWDEDPSGLLPMEKEHYDLILGSMHPISQARFGKGAKKALQGATQASLRAAWGEEYAGHLAMALSRRLPGDIIEIEREIRYTLGGIEMLGYVDLVILEPDGTEHYIDIKTGWRAPSQARLDWDVQQNCYYLDNPSKISILHLKTGNIYPVKRNPELIRGLEASAPQVAEAVKEGIFIPNPGEHCASCGFRKVCLGVEE